MEVSKTQRSPEWYTQRLAKFTASEFHKLMASGRNGQMFGKTALGYINDKVAEIITNGTILDYKKIDAKSLEWGNTWEPVAKEKYFLKSGKMITDCGFFEVNEHFGASPDGLISDNEIAEIKCPYDTSNHIDNLRIKSTDEFISLRYEYYIQIQVQLLATGRKMANFISYDPRCIDSLSIKIIQIERDENIIHEIIEREKAARAILDSIIAELFRMV